MKEAVLLLSGGLDSTTVAAILNSQGYSIRALTVDYGQRHIREIEAAKSVASHFKVKEHVVMHVDFSLIGGSALTDMSLSVPEGGTSGIPVTYVPARNAVFLSLALAFSETRQCNEIYTGINAIDYSGYPDCRPEFLEAFNRLARLATRAGVEGKPARVIAPLINMRKADIIRAGIAVGAPYGLSWSCYNGREKACGLCDSCLLRLKGFMEAGLEDPIDYENK
ncbi:MAG: 7-cyano-7-deazaguanine synthase QueC [Thermoplasmata archaeon]|uniref:7-cyano-7-deazaguanine synthase n=1 Tax=Candidatus Sysuiplasma superficiale TaxID=2823368 RepID=A0A8J8CE51_9ARCH|nr:7-cyano-7-deazaguanine synthase QueC [Candidatus Sysuiplasma superficiale]MBX8643360.1 7-cyano-7-deazaguanine synthase QueC [Candidatus Sysuiplasma superficiale]